EIPAQKPDIILLVIESLSSINSFRTSGVQDLLPSFDRLSEQGLLFTHFMANHAASEGGIIALLSGFPPLHYPTATPLMFDEFAAQPAVIHDYRRAGYFVEFLTNADLSFIGLDRYLDGLDIDLARGRDEVAEFQSAPRFVQDAPSDRFLYSEALQRLDQRAEDENPWLLVLATSSTHLPDTHPEGGDDTAEAVWDWAMARLEEFVGGLEQRDFFDNGLLLITGDHRQMRPLTEAETERYGDSARTRVPLLAIGPGLPGGEIDNRLFQQADLLRYLGRINRPGERLTAHPVWVERYNRIYGRVESINRFRVFELKQNELAAYPVRVLGTDLQWLQGRPESYRFIEAGIHAQRSAHQFARNGDAPACGQGLAGGVAVSGGQQGLSVWRLQASNINALRNPEGPPDFVSEIGSGSDDAHSRVLEWYLAFLDVEETGTYWFRSAQGSRLCMSINGHLVLDQLGEMAMQAPVELEQGRHLLDIRFAPGTSSAGMGLQWVEPGLSKWRWRPVPTTRLAPALPRESQQN
ncbi:MAG: sulfatase-like hydrolase/transferase, partial [Xanthomonadales bacterium]|nr:sulfatase-like hydrolase/transferase [Xanthomonadales bacterium]